LGVVRSHTLAAARRLDLHDKAVAAWRHAFEPIQLADNPAVWLQITPRAASFAGVRADARVLRGSLELSGTAATIVGQNPPAVTPTSLPPLGHDVAAPGEFDVVLPVMVGYDVLKDKLKQAVAAIPATSGASVRDVDVYPSSGKLVIGLNVAKSGSEGTDPGKWIYLTAAVQVDADGREIRLSDLAAITSDEALGPLIDPITAQLGSRANLDYGIAYDNLLNAANARLTRPLKDGFRMEGHLSSAKLEKVYLPADGIVIAFRVSGNMSVVYGQ
jgi:hypothetical protein